VLQNALEVASSGAARITLLHVIQKVAGIASAELADFYGQLREKGDRKLAKMIARVKKDAVPIRPVVLIGEPAPDILRYATRNRVDLIVMGSHPVDPAKRAAGVGWGTTSYKVALLCSCPVMLVK
jgi:nucleotide-binding universal stress UspA family protein